MFRIIVLGALLLLPFGLKADAGEQLIFRRIVYLYGLKKEIGQKAWPGFGRTAYNVPLIYYTDTSSYVANPTEKFLRLVPCRLLFSEKGIRIHKTDTRLEGDGFQMFVYFDIKDTGSFYYREPFMRCSGVEETARRINRPPDTRGWAAIILHEFFHGFQYLHLSFREHTVRSNLYYQSTGDTLHALYGQLPWYKEAVDRENAYARELLAKPGKDTTGIGRLKTMIRERRTRVRDELGFDITRAEKGLEAVEGTARYLEAYVIGHPSAGKDLSGTDPHFLPDTRKRALAFDELPLELHRTDLSDRYYYAQGYLLCRLLDKFDPDYKKRLLREGDFTLEQFL